MSADPSGAGFGRKAAKGAAYLGISQAVSVAANLLSIVVIARILPPADYGILAMAAPVTGFILIFQDLGFSQAVIQARDLTNEQVNSLFWCNVGISAAIAVALLAISPVVAAFYDDARPAQLVAAGAATVLVTGLSLQHIALLNRDMHYRALGLVIGVNAIAGFLFSLIFVLWLRSYWALWAGGFCAAVLMTVCAWVLNDWRPRGSISLSSSKSLIAFGANLTGFNLLNFLSRNVDNVLIAKFWGAAEVGLYDRSYKIMLFPIQNISRPLQRVMLPILGRLIGEPERYRRAFLLTVRTVALASAPGMIASALCSRDVVVLLLGPQWERAGDIFFWLALTAVVQSISNAAGYLFTTTGRTKEMFFWAMFSTPLIIGSFVAGLPWGAAGVARSYFIGQIAIAPALFFWATRGTPVRAMQLYSGLVPVALAGSLTALLSKLLPSSLPGTLRIALVLVSSYAISIAILAATKDGREVISAVFGLLRRATRRVI